MTYEEAQREAMRLTLKTKRVVHPHSLLGLCTWPERCEEPQVAPSSLCAAHQCDHPGYFVGVDKTTRCVRCGTMRE